MVQQVQQKGKQNWDKNKEPVNKDVLNNFIKTIDEKNFLNDEILKSTDGLGKYFALLENVSNNQARKFFNQFRILSEKSASDLKIQLRIIQSQVAYSVGRKVMEKDFKIFLDKCIEKILSKENIKKEFNEFMKFFEALYAYFYYHLPPNKKKG